MGLMLPVIDFIVQEHKYRPITGEFLYVARQTVSASPASIAHLFRRHGIDDLSEGAVEYDNQTRGSSTISSISDRQFARSLGVKSIRSLDVTDYEGADIVHDLGYPIDQKYYKAFDFIYNGGCFDNMFNPGVAMLNLAKMVKPGGRLICMESASTENSPYLMFSPGWFYHFFALNGWADCKIYLVSYGSNEELTTGPLNTWALNMDIDLDGPPLPPQPNSNLLLFVVAERGTDSTDDLQPVHSYYRAGQNADDRILSGHQRIKAASRPYLNGRVMEHRPGAYGVSVGTLGGDPG